MPTLPDEGRQAPCVRNMVRMSEFSLKAPACAGPTLLQFARAILHLHLAGKISPTPRVEVCRAQNLLSRDIRPTPRRARRTSCETSERTETYRDTPHVYAKPRASAAHDDIDDRRG
jgi:hypothetical protein